MIFKNLLFYNDKFYINKDKIYMCYTHNRLKENDYIFLPLDINTLKLNEEPIIFDTTIILLDHFHFNPAHNLWDHLYPSWYRLFEYFNNKDFQYLTKKPLTYIFGHKHLNLIETFSGNKSITFEDLKKFNKPIKFSLLITGLENIGISHINKDTLCIKRGYEFNNIDPIETFINRIYLKYNINRNSLYYNLNKCNYIIYITNKRPYNGINKLFNKLKEKYNGKYNFLIINYSKYNFKEQLNILNNTCICITGVGTSRFNTPFLPNGAIEIQTFQPNIYRKNYIEYVDYHGGTLSKYIKIKNIPYYTLEEAKHNNYSHLLEEYIEISLNELPYKVPINLEDNIPKEIKYLKNNNNFSKKFNIWRKKKSNTVEDLIDDL